MNSIKHHKGIVVPIVTPLTAEQYLDEPALSRMIHHLLGGNVDGIFVLGTTGEAVSLTFDTKCQIITQTRNAVKDSVPLYVGISHTCIAEVLKLERFCRGVGIQTVVVHPPYYYPLAEQELERYYLHILDSVSCDVILYNIPALTKIDIPIGLIEKLSTHPKVIGLKDSSKDIARLATLLGLFSNRADFAVFVGVSAYMLKVLRLGATGCVPGIANLVPGLCSRLYQAHLGGETALADQLNHRLGKINDILQSDQNGYSALAKLKAALESQGLSSRHTAWPLLPATDEQLEEIRRQLEAAGVTPEQPVEGRRNS